MSTLELVLVYLLVFALVQLAMYRYLRRRDDDEDGDGPSTAWTSPPGAGPGPTDEHVYRTGPRDRSDGGDSPEVSGRDTRDRVQDWTGGSGRRCPNCGTRNEADEMYTFCRNCVNRLPG